MIAQRVKRIVNEDRVDLKVQRNKDAEDFFDLTRQARAELSNTLFNDWLYSVGMYGSWYDRLQVGQSLFNKAKRLMND